MPAVTRNTSDGSTGSTIIVGGGVVDIAITENKIVSSQGRERAGWRFFGGGGPTRERYGRHATGVPAGEAVLAPGNWWGSANLGDVQAEINGPVIFNTFRASGVDAAPATPGFQPAGALISTLVVTTEADEDDPGATTEAPGGTGLSLREAIRFANANADADTITFDPSLAGETLTLGGSELVITNDVTIDGDVNGDNVADITVSGNDVSRVFNIDDGLASAITANLNGLVVRDGFYALDGGAIRVADDTLIVTNSTITENVAQRQGGGIINFGTTTLINTILSGNQSTTTAGPLPTSTAPSISPIPRCRTIKRRAAAALSSVSATSAPTPS